MVALRPDWETTVCRVVVSISWLVNTRVWYAPVNHSGHFKTSELKNHWMINSDFLRIRCDGPKRARDSFTAFDTIFVSRLDQNSIVWVWDDVSNSGMKVCQPYLEQKDSFKPKRACLFTSGKEERGTRKGNQKLKMGWKQRKGMYYRAGYTVGSHFHFHLPVPWLSNLQGLSPLRSKDILQVDLSLLGISHFVPWESEVFSACSVCHEMLRRSRADATAVKAWH